MPIYMCMLGTICNYKPANASLYSVPHRLPHCLPLGQCPHSRFTALVQRIKNCFICKTQVSKKKKHTQIRSRKLKWKQKQRQKQSLYACIAVLKHWRRWLPSQVYSIWSVEYVHAYCHVLARIWRADFATLPADPDHRHSAGNANWKMI